VKIRITIGDVDMRADGLDLTVAQLRNLTRLAASIALALPGSPPEIDSNPAPIGFTANLERNTEPLVDFSEWFEDEE
jgi:hypothetical protein